MDSIASQNTPKTEKRLFCLKLDIISLPVLSICKCWENFSPRAYLFERLKKRCSLFLIFQEKQGNFLLGIYEETALRGPPGNPLLEPHRHTGSFATFFPWIKNQLFLWVYDRLFRNSKLILIILIDFANEAQLLCLVLTRSSMTKHEI